MDDYQAPKITEIGTIANFTRGDSVAFNFDGIIFHRDDPGGGFRS